MHLYVLYGSRKRVNILLYSFFVYWLVFITESVSWAVRTEFLNKLHINYSLNFVTVGVEQETCVPVQRVSGLYTGSEYTRKLVLRRLRAFFFCNIALSIVQSSKRRELVTQKHSVTARKKWIFNTTLWKPRVLQIMSTRIQGMSKMFKHSNCVIASVQKSKTKISKRIIM
jgi:hypothetical protein